MHEHFKGENFICVIKTVLFLNLAYTQTTNLICLTD